MSLPYRGDDNFAKRTGYGNSEDLEAVKAAGPARGIRTPKFDALSGSNESLQNADAIRRLQVMLGDRCCPCFEALPRWLFILFLLLMVFLLALFIGGMIFLIVTQLTKSKVVESDLSKVMKGEAAPDFEQLVSLLAPDMSFCRNFGYACASDPTHVVNIYQRCDGVPDCQDGSDEDFCSDCHTTFKCPISINITEMGKKIFYKCLRGNMVCNTVTDCLDGSDERKCLGTIESCDDSEIRCEKTGRCISKDLVCDGDPHCPHGEDELNCDKKCHRQSMWCPATQRCIPPWLLCNGVRDCPDGNDEQHCSCTECCGGDRILCPHSSICIKTVHLCDGYSDCPDGADEKNCFNKEMSKAFEKSDVVKCEDGRPYQRRLACSGILSQCKHSCDACSTYYGFKCGEEHTCIPQRKVCDGVKDCIDGSDESNCVKLSEYRCPTTVEGFTFKEIRHEQRCDGIEDCPNGEDEVGCQNCRNGSLLCAASSRCIPASKLCNGANDCQDGSDERNCANEDCLYREVPLYRCEATGRCIHYEHGCYPGDCRNDTINDKLFCLAHQAIRRRSAKRFHA